MPAIPVEIVALGLAHLSLGPPLVRVKGEALAPFEPRRRRSRPAHFGYTKSLPTSVRGSAIPGLHDNAVSDGE